MSKNNGDVLKEAADLIQKGFSLLSKGPLDFYLREMSAAHEILMTRFSPFKIGDRVMLKRAPMISEDSGWWASRHFLIAGAAGKVVHADCGSAGFQYDIEFDNETWKDREGVEQPVTKKHSYRFGELSLVKI